jgi:hypothetical protein
MGSEKEWRSADADRSAASGSEAHGAVEKRVDLLHTSFDSDELRAAFDHEPRVEAVALVHLEREAAEVAQALFANEEQSLSLPLQLPDRWHDVPAATGSAGSACTSSLCRH